MQSRTSRVHLAIAVFVYGNKDGGTPFKEFTKTVSINASGCLLELSTPVVKDQSLLLVNMKSNQEVACQVVSARNGVSGSAQVALRFREPSPRFWGLAFPPEDWDPSTRKRPQSPKTRDAKARE